jgi:predicted dehydrogenase
MNATTSSEPLRWGILATGRIAHKFADGLKQSRTGSLVAVASRDQTRANAFAAQHGTQKNPIRAYGDYTALLTDPTVQAVYIATPHPQHLQWAVTAAKAGKHILCEKPIAMNHAEAALIFETARKHNVFAMEAFMYRCHPQTRRLVELVRDGAIGQLKHIRAAFSFRTDSGSESRLIDPLLGGGGILDVGCYTLSISRLIAGAALGESFTDPLEIQGYAQLEEIRPGRFIDAYAVANLKFPKDILAQLSCGVRLTDPTVLQLHGTEGRIEVPNPFTPGREDRESVIHLHKNGAEKPETVRVDADETLYALEADNVAQHLSNGQSPAMTWDDTLGNMAALDRWRDAVGLSYDADIQLRCGC